MKIKWNKVMAVVLTAGIFAGSLAGCGSVDGPEDASAPSEAEQTTEADGETGQTAEIDRSEYYEVTIYGDGVDPKYAELQENNSLHRAIKEKFNMGFKFESIPGDSPNVLNKLFDT